MYINVPAVILSIFSPLGGLLLRYVLRIIHPSYNFPQIPRQSLKLSFSLFFLFGLKNNSLKHAPGIGPVVPQECSDCGKKFNVGGPIWSAPIHDQDWVLSTLTDVRQMKDRYPAYNKITSVLTTVSEVLPWLVSLFCQVLLLMHM